MPTDLLVFEFNGVMTDNTAVVDEVDREFVADAHLAIEQRAKYVLSQRGGHGTVCERCDLLAGYLASDH